MIRNLLNSIIGFVNTRLFMVGAILAIQLLVVIIIIFGLAAYDDLIAIGFYIINILIVIKVVNRYSNTSYKLAWIIIILGLPLAGCFIYLLFAEKKVPAKLRNRIIAQLAKAKDGFFGLKEFKSPNKTFEYLSLNSRYPIADNTKGIHFKDGESYFKSVLKDINEAKHFIFIEYFIVKDGYMLDRMVEALKKAIVRGVKVYFLYDDGGSITCLPENFEDNLSSCGIKVKPFSKVSLRLSLLTKTNNRSHRKIFVIDNKIAYTGGFNLADEYINKIERFGYWKDTGVRIEGEAVWNFTVTFIQFYNASVSRKEMLEYMDFKYEYDFEKREYLYLPFSDSPTDEEDLCRTTHLNLINQAKKYIYIHTPYLILDYDMANTLCISAKSGVEVIITLPHIPDKKTVFEVTRSHYEKLIEAGVKIYEFTPGFLHSKMIVSDDEIALESTFNMDYRSYYLNYECGILTNDPDIIKGIKEDYLETLEVSKEITLEEARKVSILRKLVRGILNVFSPLL